MTQDETPSVAAIEHAPLPWYSDGIAIRDANHRVVSWATGGTMREAIARANANLRYIIAACNGHHKLRLSLRTLINSRHDRSTFWEARAASEKLLELLNDTIESADRDKAIAVVRETLVNR